MDRLSYYDWIVNDVLPNELLGFNDFDIQSFLIRRNSFLKDYIINKDELENELLLTSKNLDLLSQELNNTSIITPEQQQEHQQKKALLRNLENRVNWITELKEHFGKKYSEFLQDLCLKFNINPKVVLVTLQKEQSIVVKAFTPPKRVMDRALGFGATDRGDMIWYYGFEIQHYKAIRDISLDFEKYKKFEKQPTKIVDNGFLKINPVNAVTSVLYEYTPWTGSPDSVYYSKWGIHGVYLFWKIWRWWWPDDLKNFYHMVVN